MKSPTRISCDGCGQLTSPEHIARRLKRLENMTRYRPIHVQALFLAGTGPAENREHLYSADGTLLDRDIKFLRGLGVETSGRTVETVLTEFQRRGYLLAYVVECAEEKTGGKVMTSLAQRIPATWTRIRRSFKPKRLVLLGAELTEFIPQFLAANLDATLVLRDGEPFEWNEITEGELAKELAAPLQAL